MSSDPGFLSSSSSTCSIHSLEGDLPAHQPRGGTGSQLPAAAAINHQQQRLMVATATSGSANFQQQLGQQQFVQGKGVGGFQPLAGRLQARIITTSSPSNFMDLVSSSPSSSGPASLLAAAGSTSTSNLTAVFSGKEAVSSHVNAGNRLDNISLVSPIDNRYALFFLYFFSAQPLCN
ncbi:MAG: hypothetical protein GY696_16475 [Gammaproteobacteria bacterium]|nr:hypothetical protein [Gammaproteobacteria bacterium]